MRIWVDADACPREIREVVFRAAMRRGVRTTLVANVPLSLPRHPNIDSALVPSGADKADDYIVAGAGGDDLAVTADVPLAARLVEKGVHAVDPRGREYTAQTIGDYLATRNLMDSLRSAGLVTGGPKEFGPKDVQLFANALDRHIAKKGGGKA